MENKFKNFNENFSVKDKNVILTGTSSGIGLEIAKMFARKGANIIAFDLEKSKDLEDYFKEKQIEYEIISGDITKEGVIDNLVEQAKEKFSKIDVLVNCAGVGILESLEENTAKIWNLTMAVNLTGAVNLAIAVGKQMITSGGGSIINMGSQAGLVALENHLAYGVAKAGLIQATKQMALEWGKYNVRTNVISPTVILTPMGEMNWDNEKGEAMKKTIPLRRFGYPQEVAACTVYLASDAGSLFNGSNLVLDGGYTIA